MKTERIQKFVAASGKFSRREVERLVVEGKVRVNGAVVSTLGFKVDPHQDRIEVRGHLIPQSQLQEKTYLLLNKPRHVIVTRHDPEDRETIYDLLPKEHHHLKPVGRLDYLSQGALIITNDGDLILKLTHPRYHLEKIYEVKVVPHPDEKQLNRLRRGVIVDGKRTLPAKIDILHTHDTSTRLRFTLIEGRNRQIRNMCQVVGLTVKEIFRIAIGPINLKNLRSGRFRKLSPSEMRALNKELRQSS